MIVTQSSGQPTEYALARIRELMKADSRLLGFVPLSAKERGGVPGSFERGHFLLSYVEAGIITGYCLWSESSTHITIVQLVVAREYRRLGHATAMVDMLLGIAAQAIGGKQGKSIRAKVRGDLEANLFWKAYGFEVIQDVVHPSTERLAHIYELEATSGKKTETV